MVVRYDTPEAVAQLLARFAPKKIESLLDPATGSGALIRPFLKRNSGLRSVCIDIDRRATDHVKAAFQPFAGVTVVNADFLKWSLRQRISNKFDCVVMNPPFAARKESLVRLEWRTTSGSPAERSVPIEVAFVYRAIRLLKHGGRILAVVPTSVIAAQSGEWLRRYMIAHGAIKLTHELPARTFSGVEGRMYLLVFEKGSPQSSVSLRNHRLLDPDEIRLSRKDLHPSARVDYAYYEAATWYARLRQLQDLAWKPLHDVLDFWRGEVGSPISDSFVLHTTNYSGFNTRVQPPTREWIRPARIGDILCKRVARSCADSFRPFVSREAMPCSDCIFILRPKAGHSQMEILFALRVLLAWRKAAALVENGVGATFISQQALSSLQLPTMLAAKYRRQYRRFRDAAAVLDWDGMSKAECQVRARLLQH